MNKRILQKVQTFLLVALVSFSNISGSIALAAGNGNTTVDMNGTGSANNTGSGDPILNPPGVLIRINTVPNTVSSADADKIAKHNQEQPDVPWNYAMASAIDARLYELPEEMLKNNVVNNTVLIYQNGSEGVTNLPSCMVNDEGLYHMAKVFQYKYLADKDGVPCGTYAPYGAGNYIIYDSTLFEKFKKGQLTWEDIKTIWRPGEIKTSAKQFVYLWQKPETVSEQLNNIFTETGTDAYYKNMLHYLDFLLAIWSLQGGTEYMDENYSKQQIEAFLKTLNQDSSAVKEYTIVDMVTVSCGAKFSKEQPDWRPVLALPVWYSKYTDKTTDEYRRIVAYGQTPVKAVDQVKQVDKSYRGNPVAWEKDISNRYETLGKSNDTDGGWRYVNNNRRINWWSKNAFPGLGDMKQTALMCLPTDMYGDATGGIGYTYFTTGFMTGGASDIQPAEDKVLGQFTLTASSDKSEVPAKGTKVDADIFISLKQSTDDYTKIEKLYRDKAAKGQDKAKLYIDIAIDHLQGNAESAMNVDAVQTPSSDRTIENGKRVIWSDVTLSKLDPYLKGKYNFHLIDSLININEDSTNRYKGNVKLVFGDNSSITFEAKGVIVVNKTTAADDVEWQLVEEKDGSARYYSIPEDPKAEIKEGKPGNEKWEAMAGVPTTEDLYVGFGATEFMTNTKVEQKTSPENHRYYRLTYVAEKCADNNEKCEYSCPGHTFSVSGGHELAWDEKGNVTETCDGESITVYCDNGPVSGSISCSCGESTKDYSVTPKYGLGYTECIDQKDKTTKLYTGMGCEHTVKTNKCHTHAHTFYGEVQQPIGEFNYMDITDMKLWQLQEARLEGNPDLLSNPNQKIDPETGYMTYYTQEEYQDNNGRLYFSFVLGGDKNKWGNTKQDGKNSNILLFTEADDAATKWMNEQVTGNGIRCCPKATPFGILDAKKNKNQNVNVRTP